MLPRVVLLTDDLLFGSKVEAMIEQAGGTAVLTDLPAVALEQSAAAALLIVDLVSVAFDGSSVVATHKGTLTLGYFAHTNERIRTAALAAGFDKVVPRSRLVREGSALIAALLVSRD